MPENYGEERSGRRLIVPGYCVLNRCTIGGVDNQVAQAVIFHVSKIQIFEDHCKPYFTAQMVIETYQHAHEHFLYPTSEVLVDFTAPSSDPSFPAKRYVERFRVFSYESQQMPYGQQVVRIQHTLSLMGQEFYNDRHNFVNQLDSNQTGTGVAKKIHDRFITSNGNLRVTVPSSGMIGSEQVPNQLINQKPFTAINQVLSRCTWTRYPSCAPVYFRNKQGYVMGPLQHVMESAAPNITFTEYPAEGGHRWFSEFIGREKGYTQILALKPLAPSGEASSGVRASEVGNLGKAQAWVDLQGGSAKIGAGSIDKIIKKLGLNTANPQANAKIQQMLAEAQKGRTGGLLFNFINELMQDRAIDKNGPGNFQVSQEAFVTALTYADKYWVTVPGQGGHKVTCGDKIIVNFHKPQDGKAKPVSKRLYVARLVHTVEFTRGTERKPTGEQAMTDIYGVSWG
jgi:hypothetical protein